MCLFLLLCHKPQIKTAQQEQPPATVQWSAENSLIEIPAPPLCDSGSAEALIQSCQRSRTALSRRKLTDTITVGPYKMTVETAAAGLEAFIAAAQTCGIGDSLFSYVKNHFRFLKMAVDSVLITGYYEAMLNGSQKRTARYAYPLYKKPPDLLTLDCSKFSFYEKNRGFPATIRCRLSKDSGLVPYYRRDEIDAKHALQGKNLELVWLDDPIGRFFLQIQGSGIIQLPHKKNMRVNYHASNGHPYRPIGKYLVEKNLLAKENVSMQSIRTILTLHPHLCEETFNYNPSYVFFRSVDSGPLGVSEVSLTPLRSIATDINLFCQGMLCYLQAPIPLFNDADSCIGWKEWKGFVCNQDTGGAIRTPGHVDLFTGSGREAELYAGYMRRFGMVYFLIPK
ncbi:MAG: murein transglycosylase A [Chitinivibrionales bacterium]|nr:murein transglycosylase A [Chitinivibrionales bacterium]